MRENILSIKDKVTLESNYLQLLLDELVKKGYKVIGPTLRDGAIIYDELKSTSELPAGWTDEQNGGFYRLKRRSDPALFGYAVGPHSWKKFLHPPLLRLWSAKRTETGIQFIPEEKELPRFAFIGVRSCELKAIAIQDRVFKNGEYIDSRYAGRRDNTFIVAVNCGQAGGTCFCVSMNAGPEAVDGFDLALTEVLEDKRHYFLIEIGTDKGAEVLGELPFEKAVSEEIERASDVVARTAQQMGRDMPAINIKELLYRNYEHPRWDEVANRCLTCGNCTLVCPTCFCTTVYEVTDLEGENAERWQRWDSCFTIDFSYIHGGSVRSSPKSRYRQWMTHKLATWFDQFGTSGCVGCGRCITWCPVGIDITEEVRAIQQSEEEKPQRHKEE